MVISILPSFRKTIVSKQTFFIMVRYKLITLLGIFILHSAFLSAQTEICDNGIDDDNDSLVDLNDPDCACEVIEPISLIPNPSFEDLNCCPSERSQLGCANNWMQASEPTTDLIHTCGWLGWENFPPPRPFPDGAGIMGFRDGRVRQSNGHHDAFWKEYAGACLISPLKKDSVYRFQFDVGFVDPESSPPINITFFGTTNCDNLPFGNGNNAFGCPTNSSDWEKLGEVLVSGGSGNTWRNAILEIIADKDYRAIAIGPECLPHANPVNLYYFFDNLLLADLQSFDLQIQEINHRCSEDFTLAVADNPVFGYQWYKSGIALMGETEAELSQNYGPGVYQVRAVDGTSCRLSETFEYVIPNIDNFVQVNICHGETYLLGDSEIALSGFYLDTLHNSNNCDSLVSLELHVIDDQQHATEVSILAGDTYEINGQSFREPGEYPLTFESMLGCDSLVLLKLSTFEVFIPNAFSPNFDGLNDYFEPFAPSGRVARVEMEVFNRWGGLVYRGDRWDGSELNPGVYIYQISIQVDYGAVRQYAGSVTLLR